MPRVNDLSVMVGGYAGQGVNTVAFAFARLCSRSGLHAFVNLEYPSNIRGEHTHVQVMASEKRIGGLTRTVDALLALDTKSVNLHKDEVIPGGAIILDKEGAEVSHIDRGLKLDEISRDDITIIDIPFKKIIEEVGGTNQMINTIGLGAISGLMHVDFDILSDMIRESLAKLDDSIIDTNIECARRGYSIACDDYSDRFDIRIERRESPSRMLVTGNQAVALGALKAGVKLYSAYPMSPSSGTMSYLSRVAKDHGLVTILPEDEISAIGIAIGASFGGVRAMTGTSGGGFCLMCEYMGLSAMAEVPLVIYEAQRPGPATGLPTRQEQADLLFVLNAHQGEFPRVVLAPGEPCEAFTLTHEAFNLADKYQAPVVVLSDKHLAESAWTCEPYDISGLSIDRGKLLSENDAKGIDDYKRYSVTESGISPRVLPGTPNGIHRATGNEHDEHGRVTEDDELRAAMVQKRLRKMSQLDVSECGINLHGDPEAGITLVGWGSTKLVILDAMKKLENEYNLKCRFLQVVYMDPFPYDRVAEIIGDSDRTILIENNATGQLGRLIAQKTGIMIEDKILKYDGRQFFIEELVESILDTTKTTASMA